jgi:hypothetical protein
MHWRRTVGIASVCAYALYAAVGLLVSEIRIFEANARIGGNDYIGGYEERYAGARRVLPPSGAVAYVHDVTDHLQNRTAWALTQYALAPLVVVDSLEPGRVQGPWVVGNFHFAMPRSVTSGGFTMVRDFGNGVFLFTRDDP